MTVEQIIGIITKRLMVSQSEEGAYICFTKNDIGDAAHSILCRCETCTGA